MIRSACRSAFGKASGGSPLITYYSVKCKTRRIGRIPLLQTKRPYIAVRALHCAYKPALRLKIRIRNELCDITQNQNRIITGNIAVVGDI